jgi:NAD-dependent deacetylase
MNEMEELTSWIRSACPRRVVVLTGAGISAESGVPTFRGSGGLWERYSIEDLATPEGFARDPVLVWRWYEWRRTAVRNAEPNAAHRAIAELEHRSVLDELTVVTQNVDELHWRAGSRNVIELHGSIVRVRCTKGCGSSQRPEGFEDLPPRCDCGALLRPDVVWFGEALSTELLVRAAEAARRADLLLVVGTSAVVYPAAGIAHYATGRTVEINTERTEYSRHADHALQLPAVVAVPPIVDAILEAHR